MSSEFESWRKIFNDEITKKIVLLLNDKGFLTFEELMDALNVTSGLLGYHLRELTGLVDVVDDKYVLSEKGKQVYPLLDKLSEDTGVSRRWKIEWGITVASLIIIAFVSWYIFDFQLLTLIRGLSVAIFFSVLLYYLKVKAMTTARFIYIGIFGAGGFGIILWLFSWGFANMFYLQSKMYQLTGSDLEFNAFLIISLFVCCFIGGFIGKWIGKKRQYKWPLFSLF